MFASDPKRTSSVIPSSHLIWLLTVSGNFSPGGVRYSAVTVMRTWNGSADASRIAFQIHFKSTPLTPTHRGTIWPEVLVQNLSSSLKCLSTSMRFRLTQGKLKTRRMIAFFAHGRHVQSTRTVCSSSSRGLR